MMQDEKYNQILSEGLLMDHYIVLCKIKAGESLSRHPRIQGFLNLLEKKQYILEGKLTQKALDIIEDDIPVMKEKKAEDKVKLSQWTQGLYLRLQERLYHNTKSRQIRAKLGGKAYSFLPNIVDLTKALERAAVAYKLKDLEKIERTLMHYIDGCARGDSWFPLLHYYIIKDGSSQMVTDMNSLEDTVRIDKGAIDPNELF